MIYTGLLLLAFIAWIIQTIDNKWDEESRKACEKLHKDAYEWIDEHYGDTPVCAKACKADVDMMIKYVWMEQGREYKPHFKQSTTEKERRELFKADREGCNLNKLRLPKSDEVLKAIDEAEKQAIARIKPTVSSLEEGKENLAKTYMRVFGINHDEAMRRVEKTCKDLDITEETAVVHEWYDGLG